MAPSTVLSRYKEKDIVCNIKELTVHPYQLANPTTDGCIWDFEKEKLKPGKSLKSSWFKITWAGDKPRKETQYVHQPTDL